MRKRHAPTLYDASGHPVRLAPVPERQIPGGHAPDAVRAYRRQSVTVHAVLALTTLGFGNWIYAKWINLSNRYQA